MMIKVAEVNKQSAQSFFQNSLLAVSIDCVYKILLLVNMETDNSEGRLHAIKHVGS